LKFGQFSTGVENPVEKRWSGLADMSANVWDHVLAKVEGKINRHSFYTWFKPTSFIADDGQALTIRVPNPLFKDWLTKHYAVVLGEALREAGRPDAVLTFMAGNAEVVEAAAEPANNVAAPELPPVTAQGLNPRYTFDTFIVGPSNQFAHAACRAVAEAPSLSYNPLFIYGGVGLGKTHLMHAIGQYVVQHAPALRLTYISS
jgi:chromosomal replication initiator protein